MEITLDGMAILFVMLNIIFFVGGRSSRKLIKDNVLRRKLRGTELFGMIASSLACMDSIESCESQFIPFRFFGIFILTLIFCFFMLAITWENS